MPITEVVDAIIDNIKKNIIAKANLVSDALTGDVLVNVDNSFHFEEGQEIVLIDYGYNDPSSPHYQVFEYAVIKEVNNTYWMTLEEPIQDPNGGWLVSDDSFVQKTIGHSPLYEENVLYGDREVIPSTDIAVTVEPVNISNEWIYIMGGLSEEYRVSIFVYGKDVETEEGMKILNKYTDAIYALFNDQLHLDITNYESPLLQDVNAGDTTVIVANTEENREYFKLSSEIWDGDVYELQDNQNIEIDMWASKIELDTPEVGLMRITLNKDNPDVYPIEPIQFNYRLSEYAVFRRHGRYIYDSRIDNADYGVVQKGSSILRAASLNWFGKEVEEHQFPQKSKDVDYFERVTSYDSSSSSGP